jgi:sugar/nucleoside kinase (ribokinase family)
MGRNYNVYGIGNALVDIQYQVDPEFLKAAEIDKGVMTLVEEDRHLKLIDELGDQVLKRSSGGSAANTMIGVANLGGRAYYACKVAKDEYGDFYLQDLEAAGVESNMAIREEGTTGKCLVFITPDADRTMNTFLGITSTFGPDQLEEELIARSNYLYIEGYLAASDTGFEAALSAQKMGKRWGARVAITLSDPFIVDVFKSRLQELVDNGVDLLFCNEDEAKAFTGQEDTESACASLRDQVNGYAVTCGPRGAFVYDREESIESPGFRVDAVDTNGAGDMFAGAYLFGMTNGYDVTQSARLATYSSAQVVSQFGPRLEDSLKDRIPDILAR